MADKEFLLGNRARELLKYTNQATRIVSDDISRSGVREIITRISELDDIRDVKSVCSEMTHILDTRDKEGFTKSTYRLYGEDMRMVAKGIIRDIHAANNKLFATEYEIRLRKIDDILDGCSLLLEYIQICLDEKIIGVKKAGVWTKKVSDVKYMASAWKKNDGGRAQKLRAEARQSEDRHQFDLVRAACKDALNNGQK